MADLKFEDKNNQKKTSSVFASGLVATSATMNDTLFTLPVGSLVTSVSVITLTGSGTSTDSVDVKVGSTVVCNEAIVGAVGVSSGTVVPTYFATGGTVTVVAGADAPGTTGVIKVVVEYIETELTNGQYTV